MGGGEHSARGRLTSVRAGFSRWQGVFMAAKEMVPLPFSIAIVCTRHPATARPRRCGCPKRGGESYAREEGPRSSLAPGVDVRACWGARWRKGVEFAWWCARTRTRAHGTARCRGRERHDSAFNGDKEWLGQSERASRKAAAPANEFFPA
jgi:hypothetical protein